MTNWVMICSSGISEPQYLLFFYRWEMPLSSQAICLLWSFKEQSLRSPGEQLTECFFTPNSVIPLSPPPHVVPCPHEAARLELAVIFPRSVGCSGGALPQGSPTPNPAQSQKAWKIVAPPPEMLKTMPTKYVRPDCYTCHMVSSYTQTTWELLCSLNQDF